MPEGVVERPRLLARLDGSLSSGRRVSLIAAGPGFGKTTLASQWLERLSIASAWVSLEPEDNEPLKILGRLVHALQQAWPEKLTRSGELLEAQIPPPWPRLLDVLLSEMGEREEPLVLVLDDLQVLTSPEVNELLERIVEALPGSHHLLVLTRRDPPWPLGRWRAQRWLRELRNQDLRFTRDESAALFASIDYIDLDEETLTLLHRKVEGWAAGLLLAEMALDGADRPVERVHRFSGTNRLIADYLMEEVLAAQPPEALDFLRVAASFERFCAPLCDYVLEKTGGQPVSNAVLARMERHNQFLVPLDRQRTWYRFHSLFRDLLLHSLPGAASKKCRIETSRRAAAWFAGEGLIEEAVQYWLRAGDVDAAAGVLGEHLESLVEDDLSRQFLLRIVERFPTDAEREHLPLLVAHCSLKLFRYDLAGLADLLEVAERLIARRPAQADSHSFRPVVDAHFAFQKFWTGDCEGSIRHALRAIEASPRTGSITWLTAKAYAALALGMSGRRREAHRILEEALAVCGPGHVHAGNLAVFQACLHLCARELDAARDRAAQIVDVQMADSPNNFWLGHAHYILGTVAYERNELDEARARFRSIESMRHLVPSRLYHDSLVGLALIALAKGDGRTARAHARDARIFAAELADSGSLRIARSFDTRLAFLCGRLEFVDTEPPQANDHSSCWLEVPSVTWAERLIHSSSPTERKAALPFVESVLERVKGNDRLATVFSILRSLALDGVGRRADALATLAETVREAAPYRLFRSFLDRGPRLKALLDALSEEDGHDDYRETLRGAFLAEGGAFAGGSGSAGAENWKVLTQSELEVLELFAERLTNKEIARKLRVTPEAIKKRAGKIYRKLGVKGRREAVAVGLAKGLLATSR